MRALSIDLDYIMEPSIETYHEIGYDDNPSKRWKNYFHENKNINDFPINEKNLQYCFSIFLRAIRTCHNISFSYNHDSILDDLIRYDDIELINIDHHDDVIYPSDLPENSQDLDESEMNSLSCSYDEIKYNSIVHEGNWISLLNIQNKLNSYSFIGNEKSIDFSHSKKSFIKSHIPKFQYFTRDQYIFDNYNFDYIFVCLSPQYIPPCHWHYFSLFLIAAEEITNKKFDYLNMPIRKFSNNYAYSEVYNKIFLNEI